MQSQLPYAQNIFLIKKRTNLFILLFKRLVDTTLMRAKLRVRLENDLGQVIVFSPQLRNAVS